MYYLNFHVNPSLLVFYLDVPIITSSQILITIPCHALSHNSVGIKVRGL